MKVLELQKLFKALSENQTLLKKLEEKISSHREFKEFFDKEIMPIIRKENIALTENDFLNYEQEPLEKLDMDSLINVSGGVSNLSQLGRGFLSLLLIGSSMSSSLSSHAMLSKELIESSANKFIDEVKDNETENLLTENQITPVPEGVDELKKAAEESEDTMLKQTYSDKNYVIEALNLVDPFIFNLTRITENFRFCDASKTQITENNLNWIFSEDEGQGSTNYMRLLFPSPAGMLNVGTGANRRCFTSNCNPTPELIADIACYFHNYVRNVDQNVHDIAQSELTNLLKKNKNQIKTIILQTETKNILKKYGILVGKNKPQIDISTLEKISLDDQNRIINLFNTLNTKGIGNVKNVTQLTNENIQAILRQLCENVKNGAVESFPVEHFINFYSDSLKYNVDAESFKTVLDLLNEGTYMITQQEVNGVDASKILPKYTTEKMLMTYFLLSKNDPIDIDNFYNRVKIQLEGNLRDQAPMEEILDKFSKRLKLVEDLKINENSPYKASVLENASTCRISKVDSNKNVTFKADTFQDCADIATRHIVNLLTYDKENKWSKLLVDADKDKLNKDLEETLYAIKNQGTVPFRTLKERLQMFFVYQEQENIGADAVDKTTRSLWNYVISNMDKDVEPGLYSIIYADSKNYELKSGFENSLKLLYNIAYTLKLSDNASLQRAKEIIDQLGNIANENDKAKLINAINAVYQLFNRNASVDESSSKLKVGDLRWLGSVKINCESGNPFVIEQFEGHTRILFDPVIKYSSEWLEQNIEIAEQDEISAILVYLNSNEIQDTNESSSLNDRRKQLISKFSLFSKLYAKDPTNEAVFSINKQSYSEDIQKYIHSYASLRFLKEIQGEQDNDYRIYFAGQALNCGGTFDFDNLRFKIKNGKNIEEPGLFLIDNYLLKASTFNPEGRSWGETLYKLDKRKEYIQANEIYYYCKRADDDSVTLYPIFPSRAITNKKIIIPANVNLGGKDHKVSGIGAFAFHFSSVEEIEFENGIENLNLNFFSFGECSKLKKVVIPDSVKTLNLKDTFSHCPELENVKFSNALETLNLGSGSFSNCSSLKSLPIPTSIKNLSIGCAAFDECGIENIVIPQSTEILNIGYRAFYKNKNIKNFILNEGLKTLKVEYWAFANSQLLSFTVPNSVTNLKIEDGVFNDCENFNKLIIPKPEGEGIDINDDVLELYHKLQQK